MQVNVALVAWFVFLPTSDEIARHCAGVPMTFVDAAAAPGRKTGHIKLHGPDAFEAMRKAGRLAAEALDLVVDKVEPGVTTEALDKLMFEFAMDHRAYPA